jgi:hypothetical protein
MHAIQVEVPSLFEAKIISLYDWNLSLEPDNTVGNEHPLSI